MLPVREKKEHIAVRIKFEKTGKLQYISHLDLHRTFCRLLVRCDVPVWYSEGFTPHPRLVFATPLSVGAESVCEYMDVFVNGTLDTVDTDVICWKLRETGIDGLVIKKVYIPNSKFSTITHSDYEIRISTGGADASLVEKCNQTLSKKPLVVLKRTKSGERDVDISEQIAFAAAVLDGTDIVINARLCADSASFLNPEYLIKVLKSECGILANEACDSYSIMRTAVKCGDKDFE